MDINSLWMVLITNVTILGAVGFLAKSIVVHFLNKNIELFKSQLQADASKTIEEFKSTLEIERTRLQISYSGIFAKQADVLMKIYTQLLDLEGVINSGIRTASDWNNYQEKLDEYKYYYHQNRALIPEELDELALKTIMVGREILGKTVGDNNYSTLQPIFHDAKEKCLSEIRKLLSVAVIKN